MTIVKLNQYCLPTSKKVVFSDVPARCNIFQTLCNCEKLLFGCLNFAQTFTFILKHYLLQMNAAKFVKCKELP